MDPKFIQSLVFRALMEEILTSNNNQHLLSTQSALNTY